jgi:hypothetical protein
MFYTQLALVLVLVVPSAPEQAPPNFAGVWEIIDITPKPAGGGVAALPSSDLTVTHSATAVAMATTSPWGDVKTTMYSLDGREDKNVSGAVVRVSRSKWAGSSLVTEGRASQVTSAGHEAWTFKETMRLDARGQFVIERHATFTSSPPFHSVVTHRRKKAER